MTGWTGFALALAAFLGTHFVPTRPAIRSRLIQALGRRAWFSIYGIVSLLVTAWVIAAAGWPPYVALWPQLPWTRWVPNPALPLAIAITVLGLPARTVTLGGPRTSRLDPARPGMAALTRHPLLLALALWALSHLVPNGDLAHVILFGGFGLMALAAMSAFDARARASLPVETAATYFAATSTLSLRPLASMAWWHDVLAGRASRLALALAIWIAVLWLHPHVIGVSPLPL